MSAYDQLLEDYEGKFKAQLAYYHRNKDAINAARKGSYASLPEEKKEEIRKKARERYQNLPEEEKERARTQSREYHKKNYVPKPKKPKQTKEQRRAKQREYYLKNRERILAREREYRARKGIKNRKPYTSPEFKKKFIARVKTMWGCHECGYNTSPAAMDFHHLNPGEKDSAWRGKSLEFIKNEMRKCIILCSNCHRELHAQER